MRAIAISMHALTNAAIRYPSQPPSTTPKIDRIAFATIMRVGGRPADYQVIIVEGMIAGRPELELCPFVFVPSVYAMRSRDASLDARGHARNRSEEAKHGP
jgi:hypothetical protein